MIITGSADITNFVVKAVYDLTGATPVLKLYNQSTGTDLANCKFWFITESPSGVIYHEGSATNYVLGSAWSGAYTISEALPQIMGHLDWSGPAFKISTFVKDTDNNVFAGDILLTEIKRPNGNDDCTKNNYGKGKLAAKMDCAKGKLIVEDKTNYNYYGNAGTFVSKTIKLIAPAAADGSVPDPFTANNQNSIQIPITENGDGYQLVLSSVYEYATGNNTFIRVLYSFKACFSVLCGIDLCCPTCKLKKLIGKVNNDPCSIDAKDNLILFMGEFIQLLTGVIQPLCGINVGEKLSMMASIDPSVCMDDCMGNKDGINPGGSCPTPINLITE